MTTPTLVSTFAEGVENVAVAITVATGRCIGCGDGNVLEQT
jgi:hypothetical protein